MTCSPSLAVNVTGSRKLTTHFGPYRRHVSACWPPPVAGGTCDTGQVTRAAGGGDAQPSLVPAGEGTDSRGRQREGRASGRVCETPEVTHFCQQ